MSDLVLPGYETFREARRRAWEMWSLDSGGKLRGLLITGQLQAWRVDAAGSLDPVPKDYCKKREGVRLCTIRANEVYEMEGLPIFLKSDLQKEMSDHWERQEQRNAERRARRAGEETAQGAVAPKGKGGRPTEHDWNAIWVEMSAFIDREGSPDTYAILVDFILSWFQSKHKNRNPPARSEVHLRAKLLIDRIRNEHGKPPIS